MWKSLSERQDEMAQTKIIECTKCGNLMLITDTQRSRACPYCGIRVEARRAHTLAAAEDAFTASKVLRELKEQKKFGRKNQSTC
jgi:DNA-directed RNA polymerase subunit M/transcription elongation factor TFIIS